METFTHLLNGDVVHGPRVQGAEAELDKHGGGHHHPAVEGDAPEEHLLPLDLLLGAAQGHVRPVPDDVVPDLLHDVRHVDGFSGDAGV